MAHSAARTEFYLVIHGETDAHVRGLVCGSGWDPPLTEEGLKQARKLARSFVGDKRGIRVIFSSPLLRCVQTTDVLHDVIKVKIRVISGLAERALGQWEKTPVDAIAEFSPTAEQVPGGESLNRFRARVQESLNFILDATAPSGGCALMVTHGLFARTMLGLLTVPDQTLERCRLYRFWRESPTGPWKLEEA